MPEVAPPPPPSPVAARCPICGGNASREGEHAPFCSKRCRQIDFGKWLNGSYLISRPVEEADLDQGE